MYVVSYTEAYVATRIERKMNAQQPATACMLLIIPSHNTICELGLRKSVLSTHKIRPT